MPVISHDHKDLMFLEQFIIHNDGTPLMGEIDMYRRIFHDCENSSYTWHFWHDLRLPISIGKQSEIQIDFLLICEKGLFIIEVKGGRIGIENGVFYYENDTGKSYMKRTPFDQVSDYKYAIINNKILNASQIFIDTMCAFPHTNIRHTSENSNSDYGYKLWSRIQQENPNYSFADFCIEVVNEDKKRKYWHRDDLSSEEIGIAINSFAFTFNDRSNNPYTERSIQSIIEWLNVDNLSTFSSLQRNERIIIEGGPGTGKTTIAKAFIRKHHTLRGLYLCWNKLLESKMKFELWQVGLTNCDVVQFASFLLNIQEKVDKEYITFDEVVDGLSQEKIHKLLKDYRKSKCFMPYDYIIVDEAQDVIDKGAVDVLNGLTSITNNGLSAGRFIVFYDTLQGYNNSDRKIKEIVEVISQYAVHFLLDENKRVPTNKEIVTYSNSLLDTISCYQVLDKIRSENPMAIRIFNFDGAKSLIKHIIRLKSTILSDQNNWGDYVILANSSSKRLILGSESFYDRIATIDGIKELTKENINRKTKEISFTSILSYKGLECKHVIIVLNGREMTDSFELYIGMTRAIIDLQILVLDN